MTILEKSSNSPDIHWCPSPRAVCKTLGSTTRKIVIIALCLAVLTLAFSWLLWPFLVFSHSFAVGTVALLPKIAIGIGVASVASGIFWEIIYHYVHSHQDSD